MMQNLNEEVGGLEPSQILILCCAIGGQTQLPEMCRPLIPLLQLRNEWPHHHRGVFAFPSALDDAIPHRF